jgi:hypothetical protein
VHTRYCVSPAVRGATPQLHTVRKIQLCSNMLVRDIVTSDTQIEDGRYLPKELQVRLNPLYLHTIIKPSIYTI